MLRDRIGEVTGRGRRFVRVDVEGDAQAAIADRRFERALVDDLRARGVDEARAGLQPRQQRRVHQAPASPARAQGARSGRRTRRPPLPASRRRRREDRAAPPAATAPRGPRLPESKMPAPDHEVHPEGPRAQGHLVADAAEAQQAERPAVQPGRLRVLLLVPSAGAQVGHVVGMRRSSDSIRPNASSATAMAFLPGTVRHVDAACGRGGDVDRVVAGARADDQRERSGVHHRRGDLRRADDEHVGARIGAALQRAPRRQAAGRGRPRTRRLSGRRCRDCSN